MATKNKLTKKRPLPTSRTGKVQIAKDVKITGQQHEKLREHIVARMELAQTQLKQRLQIYEFIDREYYGYLQLDKDDAKRQRDNVKGLGLKPVDVKLPMIFSQLDEAETFLLTLLAPDEAIYSAIAPADQQKVADGLAALMNDHGRIFHHYRHYSLFIKSCLRYNFGAFGTYWREIVGNVIRNDTQGAPQIQEAVINKGNEVFAYNPYNTYLDPAVNPIELAELGEYYGYADVVTPFRLRRMMQAGELFNVDQFLQETEVLRFHNPLPQIRDGSYGEMADRPDWVNVFSAGAKSEAAAGSYEGKELTEFTCWVTPATFGLEASDKFQIWRFLLGSDKYVLHAEHLANAHAMLPINIAIPFEDHFGLQAKGPAERLIPYQTFASFCINAHQRATRKKLYGLTIYNKNVIPLMDHNDVDLTGGKVAATTQGIDTDLRKHIIQFTDGPDTTQTLENVTIMDQLMQKVMPTQVLQQVAGLERATQYQAAALVQGFNKRNLKLGKVINSQAMDRGRFMQLYNIFQYQDSAQILSPQGTLIEINPKDFREQRIEFKIADGLKGLDRLALIIHMKDLFNSVLQSQQATQQVDVMLWMDYLSTLFGDYTDFSQFRIKSQIDTLPKEMRDLAFQLLQNVIQQAEQQGVSPQDLLGGSGGVLQGGA